MLDNNPSEQRDTIELRASKEAKQAAAPESLQDRINAAISAAERPPAVPTTPGGGAAAAAGVLTAVDEDEEGAEEAPVPHEFGYHSDEDTEE